MLAALLFACAPQTAERGVAWEHVLVRHETYEDFWAGGASFGRNAEVAADGGFTLSAGPRRELGNPWSRHDCLVDDDGWWPAWYGSGTIQVDAGFEEVLPSWNVRCPEHTGLEFDVRLSGSEGEWSPWLRCGGWGVGLAPASGRDGAVHESAEARVAIDVITSTRTWKRAQYRVRAIVDSNRDPWSVQVERVTLCFSRRVAAHEAPPFTPPREALRRIDVPYRSQKAEPAELASRICSPTSVAMLLAYRGVVAPTADVAARLFDAEHDIYGNWNRAVQGAFSFGVPGYLARFSDWNEVARLVAAGQPLAISIAVKEGELDGAPYAKTAGHLLVLTGFDEKGGVRVNDPAAADAAHGVTSYRREQLQHVWMDRGGTAYVLLPKAR